MLKNFLWGILVFVVNLFVLYQNYAKGFSMPASYFIEVNQMITFIVGLIYSYQSRKFNLKSIMGVVYNSAIFAVLLSLLFAVYGAPVRFSFTLLVFIAVFVCMFVSYTLYYWLFCPDKYKKRYNRKRKNKTHIS